MKTLCTLIFILFLHTQFFSQWVLQNPLTCQADITAIDFYDNNNGLSVSDYGFIIITTDGGSSWRTSYTLREKLNSVDIINYNQSEMTAFAVGNSGNIQKILYHFKVYDWENEYTDFSKQTSNTTENLHSVYFTSPEVGYCSGNSGTILKTTNGGSTWVKLTTGTSYNLHSIYFTDSNTGYAAGGQNSNYIGIILKTTDAGATWSVKYSGQNNRYIYSIHFENSNTGWATGWNGTILKTTNGGSNWTLQTSNITSRLRSISFSDLQNGMAAGFDGTILRTTNGGTNWTKLQSSTSEHLNSVYPIDANTAFAAGAKGMMLRTENAGSTWNQRPVENRMDLGTVFFTTKDVGLINAGGFIYKTTNGGQTWVWNKTSTSGLYPWLFYIDDQNYWVSKDSVLLKTTNGGVSWTEKLKITQEDSYFKSSLGGVYFLDKNTGWVSSSTSNDYSMGVTIYSTTDGGNVWNTKYVSLDGLLIFGGCSLYFKNRNEGYFLSYVPAGIDGSRNPLIYYTTDGGQNWNRSNINISYSEAISCFGKAFADNAKGIIVGHYYKYVDDGGNQPIEGAMIIRTTDGGVKWTRKDYPTQFSHSKFSGEQGILYSVSFPTPSTGYVVGTGILKTTDSGETWVMQKLETECKLYSVQFTDADHGWTVGKDGVILKYEKDVLPLPLTWRSKIEFLNHSSLELGQDINATNGIDEQLGESDLPPLPPAGIHDARFILPDKIHTTDHDFRNIGEKNIVWDIKLQYDNPYSDFGVFIEWSDIFRILPGKVYLKDGVNGNLLNIDMKDIIGIAINNPPYNSLKIVYTVENPVTESRSISHGWDWDLISVPLKADFMNTAALFPQASSDAFGFDGKYFTTNTLENGKGYWVKFNSDGTSQVTGTQVNYPVQLKKGWNLISPFNKDVTLTQITTQPEGIISGPFYGFNSRYFEGDHAGYYSATNLSVGKGYWVKSSSDGIINYNTTLEKSSDPFVSVDQNWGRITIEDNRGKSSTLYDVIDKNVSLENYELPPLPPNGIFDARYSSGLMAERLGVEGKSILISSAAYPINIKAEGIDLRIRYNVNGKQAEIVVQSGGICTIKESSVKSIEVLRTADRTIPKQFTLHQNYPNPFNPKTKIKFDLPEKSKVNLSVYSLLGERLIELVNGEMEAGYHEVDFNAGDFSSGVYFYRIDTEKNHAVKKMLLLK